MDDLRNWEIPEYDDSMLESILEKYESPAGQEQKPEPELQSETRKQQEPEPQPETESEPGPVAAPPRDSTPAESIADRSRRIVMSSLG